MDQQEILLFEELQTNAFPALQTVMYDGWSVRFGGGFTYRVNDANPMYTEALPVSEKIPYVESLYRSSDLQMAIFKLHDGMDPERRQACSDLLDTMGYATERRGNIYIRDLNTFHRKRSMNVKIESQMTDDWLDAFLSMNSTPESQRSAAKQMLSSIVYPIAAASIWEEGRMSACGLGVLERGYVGLYDIYVDTACRRRGLGMDICSAIMDFGQDRGCHTSYLQCLQDNLGAIKMYDQLGYQRTYEYLFRTKRF